MAKAVLISIRPEWVEKIANERKTIEVRKTKPYLDTPFKCYIYCTNTRPFLVWGDVFRGDWVTEFTRLLGYGRAEADRTWNVFNGYAVGEFVCDWVETIKAATEPYGIYDVDDDFVAQTGLVDGALWDYGKGATLYGWHISKLEIYDTPKELNEFHTWKNANHAAKAGTKAQPVSMMKIAWFRWLLLKHRKAGVMWRN